MPTIDHTTNTMTCTRDEFTTLVESAVENSLQGSLQGSLQASLQDSLEANLQSTLEHSLEAVVEKSVERKMKSLPNRSALTAVTSGEGTSGEGTSHEGTSSNAPDTHGTSQATATVTATAKNGASALAPVARLQHSREKILKTFRFFHAVAANDRAELRAVMSSYEPEYVRVLNAQLEGTNNIGGYLVPPEFYADVLFLLNEYGFARKYCAQIQMRSNVLNVSTLAGKPSVAWTNEAGTIPTSRGTFGRLVLTAQKLAAIYPISNELLQDANVDIYNTILQIFVEVFSQEEDTQVFRGTGSPFTGILNTAGVVTTYLGGSSTSTKTHFTDVTLDDLIDLVQSIPPAQQRGAVLFIEQNTLTDLLKQKDSQQRYLWDLAHSDAPQVSGVNGLSGTGLTFRGYPVVTLPNGVLIDGYDASSHPSTPFAIFGNLRSAGAWFGTHGGMELRISNDATSDGVNAFTNDLQMLRMTERIAFGVGQPGYLAVLSTSAS